nr:hypothetical protein Iba_chr10eCG11610 [Ipomoea batatas]
MQHSKLNSLDRESRHPLYESFMSITHKSKDQANEIVPKMLFDLWLCRWWTSGFGSGGERERGGMVVVKVASAGLECRTGGLGGAGGLVTVAFAEVWACVDDALLQT